MEPTSYTSSYGIDQIQVERDWLLAEAPDDLRARFFSARASEQQAPLNTNPRTTIVEQAAEIDRLRKALQVCEHTLHRVKPTIRELHAAQQASGAYVNESWMPEHVLDDLPDFVYRGREEEA